MDTNKKTITPLGLDLMVNTYLGDTNLGNLLTTVKVETDEHGNIKEHVVENIKKSLNVAFGMTEDDILKHKIGQLKKFMQDY